MPSKVRRVRERQRAQEKPVEDAEDRRIPSDAKRQHAGYRHAECGPIPHHANCDFPIVPIALHKISSNSRFDTPCQRFAGFQFFHRQAGSFGWTDSTGQQFTVALVQVVGQLFHDFRFARRGQIQPGEALASQILPIRHTRSP
jgi:hypothetical protein